MPTAELIVETGALIDAMGGVREGARIAIAGDRFIDATNSAGARVLDASHCTAVAGLIDTHVHVFDFINVRSADDMRVFLAGALPERLAAFLAHGVTTIRSCGDPLDESVALRDALQSGALRGPRLLIVGAALQPPGGHPGSTVYRSNPWYRERAVIEVGTVDAVRAAVARLAERGVDAIKLLSEGGCNVTDGYRHHFFESDVLVRFDPVLLVAAIEEAHARGLRTTVHTVQEDRAVEAIEAGADGLEHGVHGVPITGTRLLELAAKRGVSVTATLVMLRDEAAYANVKRMHDAGVPIALGTDTCDIVPQWGAITVAEIEALVRAGLTPAEALHAATLGAAAHLGRASDLGSIEPGKVADLVLYDGNPLDDLSALHRVVAVIAAGRIVVDNRSAVA